MNKDNINHPPHYAGYRVTVECIDITRYLPFNLGNAVKYIWRAGRKGDSKLKEAEDLRKAIWYLQDFREHLLHDRECTKYAEPVIRLLLEQQQQHAQIIPSFIATALHMILGHEFNNLILLLDNEARAIESMPEYKISIMLGEDGE